MPGVNSFDVALNLLIAAEGGAVEDPRDPGGATELGIAVASHPQAHADGRVTIDEARDIYRQNYWFAARCNELSWPLAAFVFDAAVNQGVPAAVRMLQKAAGVAQDGVFGRKTMAAVANADQKELAALFMSERALRYYGTRNFDIYGRGWLKRMFKLMMEV